MPKSSGVDSSPRQASAKLGESGKDMGEQPVSVKQQLSVSAAASVRIEWTRDIGESRPRLSSEMLRNASLVLGVGPTAPGSLHCRGGLLLREPGCGCGGVGVIGRRRLPASRWVICLSAAIPSGPTRPTDQPKARGGGRAARVATSSAIERRRDSSSAA
eukprot:CAMPEP_0196680530 /NCGR_PEP_ID=MMETSP1090-20130531/7861_1 /TAXON_ID=37098 /ORGANISM="Isochrysis sp, Strain CCMP1244" /LENGTH=158 /DNA_ID=CAMNT_0042018837 /DNA_START=323 /DNA_END=795 /DNA_ORIENTATION=-